MSIAKGTTTAALSKLLKRAEKISMSDLSARADKKHAPAEVTELVATILAAGIRANASAIHVEPQSDGVHIRHRIDGVLSDAQLLPRSIGPILTAGLKILVSLPVSGDDSLPRLGSTTVTVLDKTYRLRVATIPVEDGEKTVIQLAHIGGKAPTLAQLGYFGPNLQALSAAIAKPKGLVLLAGPHDAGQAETVYSILSSLNSQHTSIATIEDPAIYRIDGAAQTQVNARAGLNFASGLRTLLRQDSNIIWISSLQDKETIHLTLEGALAGRLLFAGVNVDNAAGTIGYLQAAGVQSYMIAHALQAIVSQRLVRRLCENCKQIYTPSEQDMINVLKSLGVKTAAQLQRVRQLEQQAIDEKVVVGASPASDMSLITKLYGASKDGCNQCSATGYKGTIGLYEVLPVSETVQRLIMGGATTSVLQSQALQEGMPTIQMDGLVKILLGLTSVDEVVSATA